MNAKRSSAQKKSSAGKLVVQLVPFLAAGQEQLDQSRAMMTRIAVVDSDRGTTQMIVMLIETGQGPAVVTDRDMIVTTVGGAEMIESMRGLNAEKGPKMGKAVAEPITTRGETRGTEETVIAYGDSRRQFDKTSVGEIARGQGHHREVAIPTDDTALDQALALALPNGQATERSQWGRQMKSPRARDRSLCIRPGWAWYHSKRRLQTVVAYDSNSTQHVYVS